MEQPFYGVQPHTPETGLVVHTEVEAMAAEYVEAMRSVQPAGPYYLGGWSMGGVIAFEMARQLQEQGETIGLLALIDASAPTGAQSDHKAAMLLASFALDLGISSEKLHPFLEKIASFPPMMQLRKVWAEAKAEQLIPADMTLVEFRRIFDIFKINASTMESYRPREYNGRITLITSEHEIALNLFIFRNTPGDNGEKSLFDPDAPNEVNGIPGRDPLKGWGQLASGGVDLHVVPGDHFSMLREPHVSILAEQLRACIQQATENF